jgi:hypothetical protein
MEEAFYVVRAKELQEVPTPVVAGATNDGACSAVMSLYIHVFNNM